MTTEIPANILGWAAYIILMSLLGWVAYRWRDDRFDMVTPIIWMVVIAIGGFLIANVSYGWIKLV